MAGFERIARPASNGFSGRIQRNPQSATIVTTNRPIQGWGKMIGDTVAATAILDRFLHHATVITIKGRSYRLNRKPKPDNQEA